jgi:hypothetical protein
MFRELAPSGRGISPTTTSNARLEVFNALLDGLTVRALYNPELRHRQDGRRSW